jgi:hypothetical protein
MENPATLPASYRISRVQKSLQWFEQDIPLLNMRVKDLSPERQRSAKQFAAALVSQARAELDRLLKENPECRAEVREKGSRSADQSGSDPGNLRK